MKTRRKSGLNDALSTSREYLDIIHAETLSQQQAQALARMTVDNFANHYNPGFLQYRKSVTEGGDFAAVEWSGRGATFTDVFGREYIRPPWRLWLAEPWLVA